MNRKEQKKLDSMCFREFLEKISVGRAKTIRQEFADSCKVEPYTIRNWIYGMSLIPDLMKDKIEEVAGEVIFKR